MGKRLAFAAILLIPAALLVRLLWGLPSNRLVEAKSIPLSDLLSAVPEPLRFEPARKPASENAWPGLMAASEGVRRLSFEATQALDRALHEPSSLANAAQVATLEEVFARHRGSLSLAVQAVGKPEASVFEVTGGANPAIVLRGLQTLTTLLGRRGLVAIAQGHSAQGVDDLIAALRVGERLYGSGGPIYFATLGSSLIARAAREIRFAAGRTGLGEADLKRLMDALPSEARLKSGFQTSIRSELHWFLANEVQRLRGPGGNSGVHAVETERRRDIDSGWREVDIIASEVLAGHPKPFDRRQTARDAWPIYQAWIENVDRAWINQISTDEMIGGLLDQWPRVSLSGAPLSHPKVAEAIEETRERVRQTLNPYGRLAIWFYIPATEQNRAAPFRVRAEVEATRLTLALRRYERRFGRLPESLDRLVEAGILSRNPKDPFSEKPFGYDASRRKLWSVGSNMRDDGGKEDQGGSIRSLDLVVRMDPVAEVRAADPARVAAEMQRRRVGAARPRGQGPS